MPQQDSGPTLPLSGHDGMRRDELRRVRGVLNIYQSNIYLFERLLKNHPELDAPPYNSRMAETLVKLRNELEKMKKYERELWEDQPGGITAPPPREKKRVRD